MLKYEARCDRPGLLPLGKQGESGARVILIDVTPWILEFGTGVLTMIVKRPAEEDPYPTALTMSRRGRKWIAAWPITSQETEYDGHGKAELALTVGNVIVKSVTFETKVWASLITGSDDPPDPLENWITALSALVPSVTVVRNGNVVTISVTNSQGTATAEVRDGETGAAGATGATGPAGADGVSPEITVAEITGGHRLTVTDAGGEESFDVLDGTMSGASFGEAEVLVDTTTVSFAADGDAGWYASGEDPFAGFSKSNFAEDVLFTVTWDGVDYDLVYTAETKQNGSGGYIGWSAIGNTLPLGSGNVCAGDDVPFCIAADYHRNAEEVQVFAFNSDAATHTVKIQARTITKTLTQKQLYEPTTDGRPAVYPGSGTASVLEGVSIDASGTGSHAEGLGTIAAGQGAHAEGGANTASGNYAHAEGLGGTASGANAHTEGQRGTASGAASHAEGYTTAASGAASHAEGQQTTAGSTAAHAEGYQTTASGQTAHAEGHSTTASGNSSHAEGRGTTANHKSQHVFGEYNTADASAAAANARGNYVEIVGNGADGDNRSNARTLDWNGNEVLAGGLTLGGTLTIGETTITEAQLIALLASM